MKTSLKRTLSRSVSFYVLTLGLFPIYIYIIHPAITPQRLFVVALFALSVSICTTNWASKKLSRAIRQNKTVFAIAATYITLRNLSSLLSETPGTSLSHTLFETAYIINGIIVGCLSFNEDIPSRTRKAIGIAFWIVSTFGILEFFLEQNPLRALANTESAAGLAAATESWRDDKYRSQATFEHPLSFAMFIIITYAFATRNGGNLQKKAALVLLIAATLSTGSRIALLSTIIFIASTALFSPWSTIKGGKSIALLLKTLTPIAGLGLTAFLIANQSESELLSSATRVKQFQSGLEMSQKSPYLGFGAGDAAEKLQSHSQTGNSAYSLWQQTIDNLFLTRLIESGYPATILLALLAAIIAAISLKEMRSPRSNSSFNIATAIVSSTPILLVSSLQTILPLYFLAFGILLGLKSENTKNSTKPLYNWNSQGSHNNNSRHTLISP